MASQLLDNCFFGDLSEDHGTSWEVFDSSSSWDVTINEYIQEYQSVKHLPQPELTEVEYWVIREGLGRVGHQALIYLSFVAGDCMKAPVSAKQDIWCW